MIKAVITKRESGRETETALIQTEGLAIAVNDDGSVVLDFWPDTPRGKGLRVYVSAEDAQSQAPQLALWARMRAHMANASC
jgi:hypothetical protein